MRVERIIAATMLLGALSACENRHAPTSTPDQAVPTEANGLKITKFSVEKLSSNELAINFCTVGAPVGTTLRVSAFNAKDNQWNIIKELGVPCFNKDDRPVVKENDLHPDGYGLITFKGEVRPQEANGDWNSPLVVIDTITYPVN